MRVLVTGGSGTLGRDLVPQLKQAGYTVRVLSRSPRKAGYDSQVEWAQAQIATGEGIREAMEGVDAIIHAASTPVKQTYEVDVLGSQRLMEAGLVAGASHFLYVSIVGIDRIPFYYYRHKLAAEQAIAKGALPWSILRVTQFHPFVEMFIQPLNRLPVGLLPLDFQFQPIDTADAARRFVEAVKAGPGGHLPDIGGPQVFTLRELAETWLQARGMRRPLLRMPLVGKVAAGFRNGYNTVPGSPYGRITWQQYLEARYGAASTATAWEARL